MNGAALLAHQLRVVHVVGAQNLDGMSAEDALLQPPGGGNCANWILGLLVNVHNDLARVLGVEPVWEDPRLARAGAEPITNPDEAIDGEELVARFAAGEARIAGAPRGPHRGGTRRGDPHPGLWRHAPGDLPRHGPLSPGLSRRAARPGTAPGQPPGGHPNSGDGVGGTHRRHGGRAGRCRWADVRSRALAAKVTGAAGTASLQQSGGLLSRDLHLFQLAVTPRGDRLPLLEAVQPEPSEVEE